MCCSSFKANIHRCTYMYNIGQPVGLPVDLGYTTTEIPGGGINLSLNTNLYVHVPIVGIRRYREPKLISRCGRKSSVFGCIPLEWISFRISGIGLCKKKVCKENVFRTSTLGYYSPPDKGIYIITMLSNKRNKEHV